MAIYNQLKWFGIKPTAKTAQGPGKQVTIGTSSTEILAANDNRTSFALIIRGSVNVHIKLGSTATTSSPELKPDDALSSNDYTGAVHGIATAAGSKVHVFEV